MKINDICKKLNCDLRSAENIFLDKELCSRIINENPIKRNQVKGITKNNLDRLIKSNLISYFRNSPMQGSPVYVFKNEIDQLLKKATSVNGLYTHIKKVIEAFLIITDKNESILYEYLIGDKNAIQIAEEKGFTSTRIWDIINTEHRRLYNIKLFTKYREEEIKNMRLERDLLYTEIKHLKNVANKRYLKTSYYGKEDIKKLSLFLEDIEMSARLYNSLKASRINTLFDIVNYGKSNFIKIRNFGEKSYKELEGIINKYGVKLK